MALTIERRLVKDEKGRITFAVFRPSGRPHYNLEVFLDGPPQELAKVQRVEYQLHPSFRRPVRASNNPKNGFQISIWTWGMFDIAVAIEYIDGHKEKQEFYLSYDLPSDDGTDYVDVS